MVLVLAFDPLTPPDYDRLSDLVFWVALVFMFADSIQNCCIVYLFRAF